MIVTIAVGCLALTALWLCIGIVIFFVTESYINYIKDQFPSDEEVAFTRTILKSFDNGKRTMLLKDIFPHS